MWRWRGVCAGDERQAAAAGFGNRRFRWMSPVVACASVRLALKVKTAREKGVEHKNVTYIYFQRRGEERGRAAACLEQVWNHLEYYTSLGISVCNNTLHFISPKAFLSGRIPSELHCLFCPRVDICHMSKAAPFPEYFTQLSGKQLRLKEKKTCDGTEWSRIRLV